MNRQQARERDEILREARRSGQSDLDLDGPNDRNGGDEPRSAHCWAPIPTTVDFLSWKEPPTPAEQAWIDAGDKTKYRYSWRLKQYVPETGLPGS